MLGEERAERHGCWAAGTVCSGSSLGWKSAHAVTSWESGVGSGAGPLSAGPMRVKMPGWVCDLGCPELSRVSTYSVLQEGGAFTDIVQTLDTQR